MTDPRRRPPPTGEHLDLDALADVLAGERPDDGHLRTCPTCTDRLAELQAAEVAVIASLATLPDPEVPEGLAERLTAALRAEPPLRTPPVDSAAPEPAQTARLAAAPADAPTSATVATLPARRRAWLPSIAAAAALVLAGGLGWTALQGQGGGGDTATTAAGGAGEQEAADSALLRPEALVRNHSGIDYADEAQRADVLPQVLAGTADGDVATAESGAAGSDAGSDTALSRADSDTAAGDSAAGSDPLERLRDPAALERCLSALRPPEQPDLQPLALDYARFDGRPALAVVLPDPEPAKLSLYVVGAGCSAEDERLLLYARPDQP